VFTPVDSLVDARMGHTATLLDDGEVLLAGGADDTGLLSSAELCGADYLTCYAVGSMSAARQFATATLLKDGTVLIAGGASVSGSCDGCASATAEIYSPATQSFRPTAPMHLPRDGHCATLLPNGDVLITGGLDDQTNTVLDSAEIYDPATGAFKLTAKMNFPRFEHNAVALADGKVLIAGGYINTTTITNRAEIYDPLEGTFTPTGMMTDSRAGAGAASFTTSDPFVSRQRLPR
jgi:Galactose oxidase, central domain/Kelch motif